MASRDLMAIVGDWNFWGAFRDDSLPRPFYMRRLAEVEKAKEVVTLKGVRRSGKSTIVTQFLKDKIAGGLAPENTLIVNFEDPRFAAPGLEMLNRLYEQFLDMFPSGDYLHIVLDEVQEVKGWEKFARFLRETGKAAVYVTGSSSKMFSEEYGTLLTGRHLDVAVMPLSFGEFLGFKGVKCGSETALLKQRHLIRHYLKEFLESGGFPKAALVEKSQKMPLLQTYLSDVLMKDIIKRFKIREAGRLEALAKYYLTNTATVQPFNRVKVPIGVSLDTVQRFSAHLSAAGLFYFVSKFAYSLKEQLLNPRKVYAIDTGFRTAMGFRFSEDRGRLMENAVFIELLRRGYEVFYWRSPNNREIDFVIKKGRTIEALVQVCDDLDSPATRRREVDALLEASKHLRCNRLLIITDSVDAEEKIKGGHIVTTAPLWRWLLQDSG